MPKQDADIFKVVISQMRECRNTNPVFGKALRILGHAETFEPLRKVLHCAAPSHSPSGEHIRLVGSSSPLKNLAMAMAS
jgi:hypothetical protein